MSYTFQVCNTESYQDKYLIFLQEHYKELNLPYPFPISLSFLASSDLMKQEAFLCINEVDEIVGVFSYICGTEENRYEDKHVAQIQVVFFVEIYRRSRLLLESLQFMIQYIAQLPETITEFRFWMPVHLHTQRLLAKFTERTNTWETEYGAIEEYHAGFEEWQAYAMEFRYVDYYIS